MGAINPLASQASLDFLSSVEEIFTEVLFPDPNVNIIAVDSEISEMLEILKVKMVTLISSTSDETVACAYVAMNLAALDLSGAIRLSLIGPDVDITETD